MALAVVGNHAMAQSAPDAPSNFQANPVDNAVSLSWQNNGNGGSPLTKHQYRFKVLTGDYGEWIDTSGSGEGETGYAVTSGVVNGTTYVFQLRALNAIGASPPSNESQVTPRNATPRLQSAYVDQAGLNLIVTFSEILSSQPGNVPGAGSFMVTVNESQASATLNVSSLGRGILTLEFEQRVCAGSVVKVSYVGDELQDRDATTVAPFGPASTDNRSTFTCGGGSGGGGGADRRPEVARELGARNLDVGAALALDLSDAFRSPAGGGLDYAASSTDAAVASVAVDGDVLTIRCGVSGQAEIRVTATDGDGRSISQTFTVTVAAPEAAWYLPPASDPALQGFVRVVNRSGRADEVTVTATDDAGVEHEPLTLRLEAHAVAHFNAADLEAGNPAKGLAGATGTGSGGWRLAFDGGGLDVEALALLRGPDGFVTAMGATAPRGADGLLRLATFNPASNTGQVSRLRLVNPSDAEAAATVTGVDDAGRSPWTPVALSVPAGAACEVDAAALESGRGLACGAPQAGLGDGAGKWRLTIGSEAPLVAMGLLSSPAGQLSNLSGAAQPDADGVWHVPLFPSASDPEGRQGFVRVINRTDRNGTVAIRALDDTDFDYGSLTLRLGAGEAVHVSSDDLEVGNAAKGLTGSTGPGAGAWRLALSSAEVEFEARAYVRHRDGFLTAMQAVAPETDGVHRVATLNPGSNVNQVGVLRLVNRGAKAAVATVIGADDRGVRPGGPVEVSVPAGAAVELTAAALESGMAQAIATGALGDGRGKWCLRVESDVDLAVMSLMRSAAGHLANLSRAGAGFGPLPSLPPPPEAVSAAYAGHRRVRAEWATVPGARYGVELLRGGTPVEGASLSRTTRTDFRWSGLEGGTYAVRVRSVEGDGTDGPWSAPSNEVVID